MNIKKLEKNYRSKQRRLILSKGKLKAVSRTSALLSGFAMVAMVEISLDDHRYSKTSTPLIIAYSILTCLVVSVHLLALMISTCILPLLEGDPLLGYQEHERLHICIEFAWILSTGFGLFLFLLELTVICWVKFFFLTHLASIAATSIIIPILILFCIFSLHFYRRLIRIKLYHYQNELIQIENRLSIVNII